MDIELAREKYKEIYGKYPNKKSSLETIEAKIAAVTPAAGKKPDLKPAESLKPDLVVEKGVAPPPSYGRKEHKRYRLFFKGKEMHWTANTIRSISADPVLRKQIEFPVDSDYDDKLTYSQCRTCG